MCIEVSHYLFTLILSLFLFNLYIPILDTYKLLSLYLCIILGLICSLIRDDFSVIHVSHSSNLAQPILYKFAAFWANHEGSMLLWSFYLVLFSICLKDRIMLRVYGSILFAFNTCIWLTSNPFLKQALVLINGQELNPILQDPFLLIHPPVLYFGYVSLIIPFLLSLTYLRTGKLDSVLFKFFSSLSFAGLSLGIGLGSWWAYHELGWGGYWFWDPVENIALIPWILTLGALHTFKLYERAQIKIRYLCFFSIAAFLVSLLGTLCVRSGFLDSVHSFAKDENRGMSLALLTLGLIIYVVSSYLYAKHRLLVIEGRHPLHVTQIMLMRWGILVFLLISFILSLGTYFPLLFEISLSSDYYFSKLVPFVVLLFLLFYLLLLVSSKAGFIFYEYLGYCVGLACLFLLIFEWEFLSRTSFLLLILSSTFLVSLGRHYFKIPNKLMFIGHFAISLLIFSIIFNISLTETSIQILKGGESLKLDGYLFLFKKVKELECGGMQLFEGVLEIQDGEGRILGDLTPSRQYSIETGSLITKSCILSNGLVDVYGMMGEGTLEEGILFRISIQPVVSFLWVSCLLFCLCVFIPI